MNFLLPDGHLDARRLQGSITASNRAMLNNAKQSYTKLNKAGPYKTKPNKTKQSQEELNRAKQVQTGPNRAKQGETLLNRATQD